MDCLGVMIPAPGYSSERLYCYLARDLEVYELPCDEDEVIEVVRMSFSELEHRICSGKMKDAKTLAIYSMIKCRDLI